MTNPISEPPKKSLFDCLCCKKKKPKEIDTRIQEIVPKSYDRTRFASTDMMTFNQMLTWHPEDEIAKKEKSEEKVAKIKDISLSSNGAVV